MVCNSLGNDGCGFVQWSTCLGRRGDDGELERAGDGREPLLRGEDGDDLRLSVVGPGLGPRDFRPPPWR